MSKKPDLKGAWALVTGASSGLGVDFARELARRGCNVVLVARRQQELDNVARRIESEFHVRIEVIAMDLARPESPPLLHEQLAKKPIRVLVNNAGFGLYGNFLEIPWEKERAMMQLDMFTLVHLTRLFVSDMLKRGDGYVLQVASIGAYQATPTYATYSAAKSFVLHYGEAINYELRWTGVSVTTICPGITATEFLRVSGQKKSVYQRMMLMKSGDVARTGIRKTLARRHSFVPGVLNSLTAFSIRWIPRRMAAALAALTMTWGSGQR